MEIKCKISIPTAILNWERRDDDEEEKTQYAYCLSKKANKP